MDSIYSLSKIAQLVALIGTSYLLIYVVYQRYFHPLAKYPGPFVASITNFFKLYHHSRIQLPQTIQALHERYGPVVRIGPNDLNFNGAGAIGAIYKAGRRMPKSQFYDAFTAIKPNIFGSRDEAVCHISLMCERRSLISIVSRSSTTTDGTCVLRGFAEIHGSGFRRAYH